MLLIDILKGQYSIHGQINKTAKFQQTHELLYCSRKQLPKIIDWSNRKIIQIITMNNLHFIQNTNYKSYNSFSRYDPPIQLTNTSLSPQKFYPTSSIHLTDSLNYYSSPRPERYLAGSVARSSLVLSQSQGSIMKTAKIGSNNKRHTLPPQFTLNQLRLPNKETSPSPSRKLTGIKFTYRSKPQPSGSSATLNTTSGRMQSQSPTYHLDSRISIGRVSKMLKMMRNKLSSKQFQFSYSPRLASQGSLPFEQIRRTNRQLEQLLKELSRQSNILTEKNLGRSSFNKQSKLTQTTISIKCEGKDSQVTLEKSKGCYRSHQKNTIQTFADVRSSLAERLPSCKQLGKTIILNPAYDFGGLITGTHLTQTQPQFQYSECKIQDNYGPSQQRSQSKGSWKEWNQIKGLVSEGVSQDLKESIHCGPDVRENRFECEMLRGFGREITESVMSFQE